jgi:hypothetical protein
MGQWGSVAISAPQATGVTYPPDTTLTFIAQPSVARPGYLSPITDPSFGTKITRISDQTAFSAPTRQFIRHAYARYQPWNSDGSKIMLNADNNPTYILDGKTYQLLTSFNITATDWSVWSNTQPNVIYALSGIDLRKYSATTGTFTVEHTFSGYDSIYINKGEGTLANDDRFICIIGKSGTSNTVMSYDLVNHTIVGSHDFGAGSDSAIDWATVSQGGNYVLVSFFTNGTTQGTGVDLYDVNMNFIRHLVNDSEHGDLGMDANGHEVYVTLNYSSDPEVVQSYRLDTGVGTTIFTTNWVGSHISCRNTDRPGWCYISDDNATNSTTVAGFNEVYAIKLDGSGTVERFAHTHLSQSMPYWMTPFAAPNRDGSKVMFTTDWGLGSAAPGYSYIAEMP